MNSNSNKQKRNQQRKSKKNRSSRQVPTVGGARVATTLLQHVPLFPQSTLRRGQLYFESLIGLTGVAGIQSSYIFSANGAFDPNITGTGHQPMGFDQMMSLYEQYVVVRSHIKVCFVSTTAVMTRVAISLNPDTSPPAIVPNVENGLMVMGFCEGKSEAGHHIMTELEMTCDVSRYFGKTRKELQNYTECVGDASANPTEQVYFAITAWALETNTYTLAADVLISYDIFYWEPRKETVSLRTDAVLVQPHEQKTQKQNQTNVCKCR